MKQISDKKIYIIFGGIFLTLSISFIIFVFVKLHDFLNIPSQTIGQANSFLIGTIIFILLLFITAISYTYVIRTQILKFSDRMCGTIDKILSQEGNIEFQVNKESLLSKSESRLKELVDLTCHQRQKIIDEQNNIKSFISDISHQIKTPIANILMYNETLIERELSREQQQSFLHNMKLQTTKLQWLMESLIKMSRLETGLIFLNKENSKLEETIAQALGSIYIKAQQKNIDITVNSDTDANICHDKKWTSEAIFNILENAVKYTESGGLIKIEVESFEIFTRIDIEDNGIGIEEDNINNIFKRFYRGKEVLDEEGVGVGLYLAREIISKQGGYIKVKSQKGIGTVFSIFLLNQLP